jgi:hypothetical protein
MNTHRMIATIEPSVSQVDSVNTLLLGALASVVGQGAKLESVSREIGEALAGRPCRESTARMVARALVVCGCGARVEACG